MRKRPHVVIISRRLVRKNKLINWVSEIHLSLLLEEGLFPVIVPICAETLHVLPLYAQDMMGLLIVEGGDVHPSYYGGNAPQDTLQELDPLKDEIEFWLCRYALTHQIPIIGFCRGMHLLNVVCGGTLYFDVQKEKGSSLKHMNLEHNDDYRHPVELIEGTPLYSWYGRKTLRVNSYHHQGIKELAICFRPMAKTPDGLIEAFYNPDRPFAVGIQFHPERMLPEYKGNRKVFHAFAQSVQSFHKKNVDKGYKE